MKVKLIFKDQDYSHIIYRSVGVFCFLVALSSGYLSYLAIANKFSFNHVSTFIILVFFMLHYAGKAAEYVTVKKKKLKE